MANSILFGFLLIFSIAKTVIEAGSISEDRNALVEFRRSVRDPQNALNTWSGSDPCTWSHVTCNNNRRVTRIDLSRYGLSGHLSPELGKLDSLEYLELFGNNFDGPIPRELGNMVNLKSLDLFNNRFSGSIPSSLGNLRRLFFVRLNNNQLTGLIPSVLGGIPTLVVVDVSNNNLCGPVPRGGSLSKIQSYNFGNNPRINKPC